MRKMYKLLLSEVRVFQLFSLVSTYLLGAGLVQYAREIHSWLVLLQGLLFLLLLDLCVDLLRLQQLLLEGKALPEGVTMREARQSRWVIVLILATFLTTAVTIFINWIYGDILWQGMIFLLLNVVIFAGLYYFFSINPKMHPYLLFVELLFVVVFPPAVAFFSQSSDIHRLLTMVIISLIPAYVSYRLLQQITKYGEDKKSDNNSLVVQIGWEKGMVFHNGFILLSYVAFALIALFGFPWFLLWPVFLTLPIGLLEIWLIERTRRGRKPLWRVMHFATLSVFFIPQYLIAFALWIR